jgi:two-component system chemotaxis response regulator CheB
LPAAVLIVQHRSPAAEDVLVQLLAQASILPVCPAIDKLPILNSQVYIAPPDYHLLVETGKTLALSIDPRVAFARPAIDVLFESAADVFRQQLTGILLTGANQDGTQGLLKIRAMGGRTIAQDPAEATAAFMPEYAIRAGAVEHILKLQEITVFINHLYHEEQR